MARVKYGAFYSIRQTKSNMKPPTAQFRISAPDPKKMEISPRDAPVGFSDFSKFSYFSLYIPNNKSNLNFDGKNAFSSKNYPRLPNFISFEVEIDEKINPIECDKIYAIFLYSQRSPITSQFFNLHFFLNFGNE